ncbi:MAG: Tim44/TimA family putative adaptor protein [Hyphomicrobiales bacterium]|nr:Tim44/TimA family putative adaptor protein [Hyphomicrobiales bacterium]
MDEPLDIVTLLFLVVAVIVFLRLRSVLGRRTGNERRYDPYAAPPGGASPATKENVVTLPRAEQRRPRDDAEFTETFETRLRNIAPKGSELAKKLEAIARTDADFDPNQFLTGAKAAYEMIVTAFAEGNRKVLKQLLSREVNDSFAGALNEREKAGERVEFRFVGISKADILDAELSGRTANLTVKFVSELISATRDKTGEVIDGDPKKVRDVTDIWTFSRDLTSRDPNWKLVATETAN